MENTEMTELYLKFRQELDKICVPEIIKVYKPRKIVHEGQIVGILCASPDYIDCVYILPEYRRKGLAKKAVLDFYKENKHYEIRLHIITNNFNALNFWNSIFILERLGGDNIDALYRIVCAR